MMVMIRSGRCRGAGWVAGPTTLRRPGVGGPILELYLFVDGCPQPSGMPRGPPDMGGWVVAAVRWATTAPRRLALGVWEGREGVKGASLGEGGGGWVGVSRGRG